MVNPSVVPDYKVELEHDGRSYPITVPGLRVFECGACKTIVLPDEAHRRLTKALRVAAGLLAPEEIKAKREMLRLTQKELAGFLRVAESTVSRWETGAQIQQRAMDLLLRLFFYLPAVRRYFGMDQSPDMVNNYPKPVLPIEDRFVRMFGKSAAKSEFTKSDASAVDVGAMGDLIRRPWATYAVTTKITPSIGR